MGKIKSFFKKDFFSFKLSYALTNSLNEYLFGEDDEDLDILIDCEVGLFSVKTNLNEIEDGMNKKVLFDNSLTIGGLFSTIIICQYIVILACAVNGYNIFDFGFMKGYFLYLFAILLVFFFKAILSLIHNIKK